jgi:phosphoglycerate dehydrogenase-like enzyme/glyoxylase-like metal-dependent hydrolase (beta-lactamase superfamily II)
MRSLLRACSLILTLAYASDSLAADEPPKMKFNDVKEVAPGVFFRYSSIGPDGSNIPFGGSNNIWVVFEDYVVVIDANFPDGAREVIAAVKKTTDKPIRYVLDTHHHGDHAYGNDVFAKEGASIVAQTNCARWLRLNGAKEFEDAGKGPMGRKDVRESKLKVPNLVFDDKLVLDDGTQRVEFLFLGHAHTPGDAFAYLPKHKLLCTGDACVNGAYNYMGHSDPASWVRVMERAQQFDVKYVLPGHGPIAGKELLEKQKRYFVELRAQVKAGIEAGKSFADIRKGIDMPWYKEWTTVPPTAANIQFVYDEMTGRVAPWDLTEEYGITEGPSPTKEAPGWTAPKRIVVPNLMPADLAQLKRVAPAVEFVPVKGAEAAAREAADADAVIGFSSPEIVKAGGKRLRWIQSGHAGVEKELSPELVKSDIVLTNAARVHGPNSADQAFALLLRLTRGKVLSELLPHDSPSGGDGGQRDIRVALDQAANRTELHGKTMLVVGLGGIGTQVSRRAWSFGMRVRAVDPRDMERPDFVFSLDKPAKLMDLLPTADVVVIACPLTDETKGLFGEKQLGAMKKTAYLVNVARGPIVKTDELAAALKDGRIAGAGLDVTDPEPLPAGHDLLRMPSCVISPHVGGQSPEATERLWRLWRENVRRFVAGEKLLCVVDKAKGY